MPVDQKRINGPELAVSYHLHNPEQLLNYESRLSSLFQDNDKTVRSDGRKPDEMRKIFLKSGTVTQAKGSAYIELGKTKLLVSVFDPREISKQNKYNPQGELYCDFKFSPFATTIRKPPMPDSEEKCLANALQRALYPAVCRNEFPNFQIDVFVNVLEDDGSVLAAAITAAGLALADAGIPMYDILTAVNCCVLDGKILMDPTRGEEQLCNATVCNSGEHGIMTISRLSTHEQVSETWLNGFLSLKSTEKCIHSLVKANNEVAPVIQEILVKKVNKFIKETENDNKVV